MAQWEADALYGVTVRDPEGKKIGKVAAVFADDVTSDPAWVAVSSGLFGGRRSLVPLADAELEAGSLRVPYARDIVIDAPELGRDQALSSKDEAELTAYYAGGKGESDSLG